VAGVAAPPGHADFDRVGGRDGGGDHAAQDGGRNGGIPLH